MRLLELLQLAASELEQAGVEEYALEARLLLGSCLGKTRTELFLSGDAEVDAVDLARFLGFIDRRKKREPTAYILGEQEFWSMPFFVSQAVLIPRPETEFLLDRVLALALSQNIIEGALLDLCCGSGVIAAVLAKETGKSVFAADISLMALRVAQANLCRHGLLEKVRLVASDLFTTFLPCGEFSLIVSNPPYVSTFDLDNSLEPEVVSFEPRGALNGGRMGLEIISRIRQEVPQYLCPGGQIFMEIGADQGEEVRKLFTEDLKDSPGFKKVDILVDYAGRDRVLHAQKR